MRSAPALPRGGVFFFAPPRLPFPLPGRKKKAMNTRAKFWMIGWTAAQGNGRNVNVLCGARKLDQIEDNARGGDVVLDAADIATMRRDAEAVA